MKKLLLLSLFVSCTMHGVFSWLWNNPVPANPLIFPIEVIDPIDGRAIMDRLILAKKAPNVVGIILLIDSVGGAASSYSMIHDVVKQVAQVKPIVALVVGNAFSGGYMVASAADYIFAHSQSGIGSIGVFKELDCYKNARIKSDTLEADLDMDILFAGEFKLAGHPAAGPATERQRTFLQEQVDKSYQLFLEQVAFDRGLNLEEATIWAEGKSFIPMTRKPQVF